jgi:hypothetical protein
MYVMRSKIVEIVKIRQNPLTQSATNNSFSPKLYSQYSVHFTDVLV